MHGKLSSALIKMHSTYYLTLLTLTPVHLVKSFTDASDLWNDKIVPISLQVIDLHLSIIHRRGKMETILQDLNFMGSL